MLNLTGSQRKIRAFINRFWKRKSKAVEAEISAGLQVLRQILSIGSNVNAREIEIALGTKPITYLVQMAGGELAKGEVTQRAARVLISALRAGDTILTVSGIEYQVLVDKDYVLIIESTKRVKEEPKSPTVMDFPIQAVNETRPLDSAKSDSPYKKGAAVAIKPETEIAPTLQERKAVKSDSLGLQTEYAAPVQILLAEDSVEYARVLECVFKKEGYEVTHALNGKEALSYLGYLDGKALLVVTDVHMPHMGGAEFVAKLRQAKYGKGVPVVALTSDDQSEQHIRLLEAGADAFISKEENIEILLAQIRRLATRDVSASL